MSLIVTSPPVPPSPAGLYDSASIQFLPSGTGAITRTVSAKLQDYVNVLDFIPVAEHAAIKTGTSTTDLATYVASAHAAIKGASVGTAKSLYWPGGTYRLSNLSIAGYFKWVGDGPGTVVKAIAGGSATYMVASTQYLTAAQTTVDSPFVIEDMYFDGNSLKTYAFVCRAFYPIFNRVNIYGATTADLYISSAGSDGTQCAGTMINGQLNHCTIGIDGVATGSYNIQVNDPNLKVTDWQINGGFIRVANTYNLDIPNCAGWIVRGVHFYGATNAWQIKRADYAFVCQGNYFDGGNVEITNGNAGQPNVEFGPGNVLTTGNLLATFGANGSNIVSKGNKYLSGQIQHNVNDASKTVISVGDDFNNATPLLKNFAAGTFTSRGSWNASTGLYVDASDFYATGSWTPTIAFGGGTTGQTYTAQAGSYTRRGDIVHCFAYVQFSAKGSSTGTATLTGLPYTIKNSSEMNGSAAAVMGYWANLSGNTTPPAIAGTLNTTTAGIYQAAASAPTALDNSNFTNTSLLQFQITYKV